jgi:ectoine hydroxylase-related dioxygenase (phytanoyl-CoA dioxygenase family)
MASQDKMRALAALIMGGPAAELIITQFHYKMPGDGVAFGPHQDIANRYANDPNFDESIGRLPAMHVLVALEPHDASNGGLTFVEGNERVKHYLQKTGPTLRDQVKQRTQGVHTPSLAAGDAVLLSPYNVHFSEPNIGSASRLTAIFGFTAVGPNGERANHAIYPGVGSGVMLELPQRARDDVNKPGQNLEVPMVSTRITQSIQV